MKTIKRIGILVIIIGAFAFSLYHNKQLIEKNKKLTEQSKIIIPVMVTPVKTDLLNIDFSQTGTFNATHELTLMAEGQGRIMDVLVDVGDNVRTGQTIARIDEALAKSQFELAEANFEKMKKDMGKFEQLVKREAITTSQYEEAKLGYTNAKNSLTMAKKNLDNMAITSPISGTITKRYIEKGSLVMPGAMIVDIVDVSKIKFITSVTEYQVNKIEKGQQVEVMADYLSGSAFPGKVKAIGVKADESKKFLVEIEVNNNDDNDLRAGMFGSAIFKFSKSLPAIIIPRRSLTGSIREPKVFVAKDNRAFERNIRIGMIAGNNVEVLGGLNIGELVITTGQINLQDSSVISVIR
jgi:membrane fusion protein, multidrug efflux system